MTDDTARYPNFITPLTEAGIALDTGGGNPLLRQVGQRVYVSGYQQGGLTQPVYGLVVAVGSRDPEIPPCRKVIRHPVPDMQGFDPVWVREIMNAALEAEGPVLFMCDYGLSRSASLAYGFLRILGARNSEARRCVSIQNFPSTLMLVSVRGAITPMLATDRD